MSQKDILEPGYGLDRRLGFNFKIMGTTREF